TAPARRKRWPRMRWRRCCRIWGKGHPCRTVTPLLTRAGRRPAPLPPARPLVQGRAMADPASLPEPDRIDGAPHPRETRSLFGHAEAQAGFLDAFRSGRLHHGWLIAGPKGIGKATLAWHLARFLLATPEDDGGMFAAPPPGTLDIPDDHPVARRMRALAE